MTHPLLLAAPLLLLASAAGATSIPMFNATCGESVDVHADEGGPIYIDGDPVTTKQIGDSSYEATHNGTTVSVEVFPDSSLEIRYSDPEGNHGLCRAGAL